ncbi:ESPR-type extended signal peptide-containing protein, partial [Testudinibacter sp. TR-2022]|uniref:ESPR-type extended signal peptide-containing protein n=3 Tax=Testudinibacter sp. TR-2022 TaxID=2585029 RepID=UPI002277D25A
MNKIYKVVWSVAKQALVVVSELASRHGKVASESKKISPASQSINFSLSKIFLALSVAFAGASAYAADTEVGGASSRYYSVNSTKQASGSNYNNDGAKGTDSLAAGVNARADSAQSTAVGVNARVINANTALDTSNSVAIGTNALVQGQALTYANVSAKNATAIGFNSKAYSDDSVAVGSGANVSKDAGGVAIGKNATVQNTRYGASFSYIPTTNKVAGIAIGDGARATENAIYIGGNKDTSYSNSQQNFRASTVVGSNSYGGGTATTVIGTGSGIKNGFATYSAGFFSPSYFSQGFGATISGAYNTISANSMQPGSTTAPRYFDGMASYSGGLANLSSNSNGSVQLGAGNTVTNSYLELERRFASAALESNPATVLRNTMAAGELASVSTIGGSNTADYALFSNLTGVGNALIGSAPEAGYAYTNRADNVTDGYSTFSAFNSLTGYRNTGTNVDNTVITGSYNTVANANENIVMGNFNELKGADADNLAKRNVVLSFHDGDSGAANFNGTGAERFNRAPKEAYLGTNLNNNFISGSNVRVGDGVDNSVVIGTAAELGADADDSIAIGSGAQALAKSAISIGQGNLVSGEGSSAVGDPSIVAGSNSFSAGNNNAIGATTDNSFIFGGRNNLGGEAVTRDANGVIATADGIQSEVDASNSAIVGYDNSVQQKNVFVLGNRVKTTVENSVFLGDSTAYLADDNSRTKGIDKNYQSYQFSDTLALNFAGGDQVVGVVSVGNGTQTRRIQNVAPGLISANSTDAINGSQLYQIAGQLTHYYSVNDNGVQQGNYNNDGASGVNALAAGVNAHALGSSTIAIGNGAGRNTTGNNNVIIGLNAGNGSSDTAQSTTAESVLIGNRVNYGLSVNRAVALGSGAMAYNMFDVALGAGSQTENLNGAMPMAVTEATVNGMTYDGFQNGMRNTVSGTVSLGTTDRNGLSTTVRRLTNLAAGRISATSTDAINGSQLFSVLNAPVWNIFTSGNGDHGGYNNMVPFEIKFGDTLELVGGTGINIAQVGGKITFSLNKNDIKDDPDFKGPKGDTGAQGEQGIPGEKGDTGAQGEQGIPGEKG